MAPKIVITEQARYEEVRLGIDLSEMTESVIKYIPPSDLVGIVRIVFVDRTDRKAMASYFRKQGTQEATIEVYLENLLLVSAKNSENFNLTLPIRVRGLAEAIFHEVGHHVRQTRSHGVRNEKNEVFANAYARRLLATYVTANASAIDSCFEKVVHTAVEKGLPLEKVQEMKRSWEKERDSILHNRQCVHNP